MLGLVVVVEVVGWRCLVGQGERGLVLRWVVGIMLK